MAKTKGKRIGILTAGGDCPGLNAAIRGIGKTAIMKYGMEVLGFSSGFLGLLEKKYIKFNENMFSGMLTMGGTILGTSRIKPFKMVGNMEYKDTPAQIKKNYEDLKLDCLVCLGGNGTMKTAYRLSQEGLNVIGIPKTIDNDVYGTDVTFGFHSAVDIATEAIDRLHTTANSHKRVMVIELMGHRAGWISLYSGMAGGGDLFLIPEIDYDENVISKYLIDRADRGKDYSIVVVAEGIYTPGNNKNKSAGSYISKLISETTGLETRETILGYIQRGGSPSPYDRIIATRYGAYAAEIIANENYNQMVALKNNKICSTPLKNVAGKLKLVEKDHPLVKKVKNMGACFGDSL